MPKRILLFILCVIFVSGCSQKKDNRVKITYQTIETLPEQRKALAEIISEFEKIHPDIKVEALTSTTSFQKLSIQIAGGNAPDVFYFVSDRLPGLAKRGALLDLTPFVKDVDMADYFQKAAESCVLDGKYYCFPFHFSTDVLFYNKDIFDREGLPYPNDSWSWDDFLAAAQKLTRKENGRVLQYGVLQPRALLLIKSFGGECFNADVTASAFDTAETRGALQYLIDLDKKYGVAPDTVSIKDMEKMDGIDMFSTGRVAMFLGRTFMLTEFRKLKNFRWDISPVPRGARLYSRLAVGGNCISASTRHPKEAWEFVKFYSGKQGSFIAGVMGNCVPALKKAAYSNEFLKSPPENARLFVDSIEYSESDNPGLVMWEEFYQRILQDTIDQILCEVISLEDGIKKIVNETNRMLDEERKMKD